MKKISILLVTLLVTFSLTGCQLAQDNTSTQNSEETQEMVPYLPIEFRYEVYDIDEGFIDVSEYFYYSWFDGSDFHDDPLTLNTTLGKSMDSVKMFYGTNVLENEEGATITSQTIEVEANAYIGRTAQFDGIYPVVTFMNYDGDIYTENGTGFGFGMSLTSTYEVTNFNGENWKIIVKLNLEEVDDLQKIEVREFDDSDNLVKNTIITEDSIIEWLTLDSNTAYYYILETFENESSELYTERYFFNADEYAHHKYKFLNDEGFVYLDSLNIRPFE